MTSTAGLILAAGFGKRMRSRMPKVLSPLLGRRLLDYPLQLLEAAGCDPRVVVVGHGADTVRAAYEGCGITWALQDPPRGTGDAAQIGLNAIADGTAERVVILNADLPLLSNRTVSELIAEYEQQGAALTLLTVRLADPTGYGRIVRDAGGGIERIVEDADATQAERAIDEVNGGIYVAEVAALRAALAELASQPAANTQGELYLPPAVGPVHAAGGRVIGWRLSDERADELEQVNTRRELAHVVALRRATILGELMDSGVSIIDPTTTHIEEDVEIGMDTVIHPFTCIRSGVRIGEGCEVGPFAHLRVETVLEDAAEVGNFMELKKTTMGAGAKAKHLSYLGDTVVGSRANIGAGTIVANYDGKRKHPTHIGDGAFLGSGTILVAPVEMGSESRTGAGAVVPGGRKVAAGETVVGVPARTHRPRASKGTTGGGEKTQ